MERETFKERLSRQVDDRRNSLTHIERVSSEFPEGHTLMSMANAMAIAMTYAQLEGFVKEALQLYLDFVEAQGILRSDAIPCLVAYSWSPAFKRLAGKSSVEARIDFAEERLEELSRPLTFGDTEKGIDTQSNLRFDVLDKLAMTLGLNRLAFSAHKSSLNALVNKRNSIAHGSRSASVSKLEVESAMICAQSIVEAIERCLHEAVDSNAYRRETPRAPGG